MLRFGGEEEGEDERVEEKGWCGWPVALLDGFVATGNACIQ